MRSAVSPGDGSALSADDDLCRLPRAAFDRVPGDEFDLSHQFLGQMLGERRPAVNVVSALMERAGFIRYDRGRVTVLDRPGLESASCGCYRIVRNEYDRMLGPPLPKP